MECRADRLMRKRKNLLREWVDVRHSEGGRKAPFPVLGEGMQKGEKDG